MNNIIIKFIVTGFWFGLIPAAPGTFGSLVAFPIFYGLLFLLFLIGPKIDIPGLLPIMQEIITIWILLIIFLMIVIFTGTYLVGLYLQNNASKDPKEVVIDEIAGQILTLILTLPYSIFSYAFFQEGYVSLNYYLFLYYFLLPFLLFRLMDIIKPWPIYYIDQKMTGAVAVMLDDLLAALFAACLFYAIAPILTEYLSAK
ncbi:MAG: phosphatidylglycerophosphatase A [Rickettsiaceae bacterium]|nr:phosphatidylglycerophosphatase A [Rickettsiaceae bacterium]